MFKYLQLKMIAKSQLGFFFKFKFGISISWKTSHCEVMSLYAFDNHLYHSLYDSLSLYMTLLIKCYVNLIPLIWRLCLVWKFYLETSPKSWRKMTWDREWGTDHSVFVSLFVKLFLFWFCTVLPLSYVGSRDLASQLSGCTQSKQKHCLCAESK